MTNEEEKTAERWENEGGRLLYDLRSGKGSMNSFGIIQNHKLTLIPPFDHKEPRDDDCGLPEHPIFSNYSKYLWTSHTRTGGVQITGSSRNDMDGPENIKDK